MEKILNKVSYVLTVIWVGSLWSMFMVTSILFNKIPSTFIAGAIAGDMFQFLNYFGIFLLSLLIIIGCKFDGVRIFKKSVFWITFVILTVVLISFFGINPLLDTLKLEEVPREFMEEFFADRYNSLHGIANIAYLFQCIMGIFLVLKMQKH